MHSFMVKLSLTNAEIRAVNPTEILFSVPALLPRELGGFADDDGHLTAAVEAVSPHDARVRAQHHFGEMLRRAGLASRQADVVWVAPVRDPDGDDLRFLNLARDLVEDERPEMAVLAAQTHLEIQVAALVGRVVGQAPTALRREAMKQRSWSMVNPTLQALIEDTLGVQPTSWERWNSYRAHLSRRNDVAHRGQDVDLEDARESIAVVEALWLWLNDAAAHGWQPRSELGGPPRATGAEPCPSPPSVSTVERQDRVSGCDGVCQ